MTEFTQDMYCQEVWDLGRSVMFFNNWLSNTYFESCHPKLTRRLYTLISKYLNGFSLDYEEDYDSEDELFVKYTQNSFNKIVYDAYIIIIQMPQQEKVSEHFEKIIQNLRNLNNYLETPIGQNKDWVRIHYEYQLMVKSQLWPPQELMNNIPDTQGLSQNN
jgi:hypothetical protein